MKPVLRGPLPLLVIALLAASSSYGFGDKDRVRATAVAPGLGTAGTFAVVGASTVTNTGPSVINGDLGVSPGAAVVGFPPGTVLGTIHAANAAALNAQNDITTLFNALGAQACDLNISGTNLGGLTLTPGVYCFSTSAFLTGTLTLDGLGNPGAVWVFQTGSTLITATGATVAYTNAGRACGTFWQVGSSATLGTNTSFSGNVVAQASITLNTGSRNEGALFARTGAVTLDNNVVTTVGSCGGGAPPPAPTPIPPGGVPTPTPPGLPPVPALPETALWALVGLLLATGAFIAVRR